MAAHPDVDKFVKNAEGMMDGIHRVLLPHNENLIYEGIMRGREY